MTHPAIRFSIYASLVCYVLALICWVSRRRGTAYRVLWSVGCLCMWGHAVAAFHYYHHWSHQHAVELTAQETEAVLGKPFGEGIWFSYLMLVLWAIDVGLGGVSRWRESAWRMWFSALVHLYVFFILFHGTVVFESGAIRWAGVIGTLWAARMMWRFRAAPLSME